MRILLVSLLGVLLGVVAAVAQAPGDGPPDAKAAQYKIVLDKVFPVTRDRQGVKTLYVTVEFRIQQTDTGEPVTSVAPDEIVVEEDGRRVGDKEVFQPGGGGLTAILALDTSGSMSENGSPKMAEAKAAASLFLKDLNAKADCGLVLFNHKVYLNTPPAGKPERIAAQREQILKQIDAARASGGTAYLDATYQAIERLQGLPGRKVVLLMTDGVDINSQHTMPEVIEAAKAADVAVFTLGVGEPGKNEPVTSILVLDHSGSMSQPADAKDKVTKIQALHQAASKFVDIMRTGAVTTLLPFSTDPELPKAFTADKSELKKDIRALRADGGTALYDATYDAIETLETARRPGKRAVVVLTDGVDESPGSRHRVEEVIERAKQTKTPLHMLGLGRDGEIDVDVMQRMGKETGGTFFHARNQQALEEIFEKLSIDLHDDGVDQKALKELAEQTGGKFKLARDVSTLRVYYQELANELQTTYVVTFPSRRSSHDGTARGVDVSVWRNGVRVSDVGRQGYTVHGVVVPEMDPGVYLVLLAGLGGLFVLPGGLRYLYRFYGGT
jgi:VWFA-related protein